MTDDPLWHYKKRQEYNRLWKYYSNQNQGKKSMAIVPMCPSCGYIAHGSFPPVEKRFLSLDGTVQKLQCPKCRHVFALGPKTAVDSTTHKLVDVQAFTETQKMAASAGKPQMTKPTLGQYKP